MWIYPNKHPSLTDHSIHIWCTSLSVHRNEKELHTLYTLLNNQEKKRYENSIKDIADNFVISRGILKKLLSKYLLTNPRTMIFHQNKYGKPILKYYPIQFNISHSKDLIVFAFTLNSPIGIDIEYVRQDFEFTDIIKKFFSQYEIQTIYSLSRSNQLHAFFDFWTKKEAVIKASGKGLFTALNAFTVKSNRSQNNRINTNFTYTNTKCDNKWVIESIYPKIDYCGAVAFNLPAYKINLYII